MNDKELLDNLAEIEYEQWCYWSKGISEDYKKLIDLLLKYVSLPALLDGEFEFVKSQMERLERWEQLWNSDYSEISDEVKEVDYLFAKKSLDVQNDTIQQLKQENMELTLKCKPLFSKRQLHEENQRLKAEIKQLNHDLDLYEENNTNEVLNKLRVELTSRMNDCIEEFKE